MKKNTTSLKKILDAFVLSMVITISISLIASGIAISKINSDYMSTGVHTSKIIAEHENQQIFISINGQRLKQNTPFKPDYDKLLTLIPAPYNSIYILIKEISSLLSDYKV